MQELSGKIKFLGLCICIVLFVTLHAIVSTIDIQKFRFNPFSLIDNLEVKVQFPNASHVLNFDSDGNATLVILTYRRIPILLKLMRHYGKINIFQEILIIWNDVDNDPPVEVNAELNNTNNSVSIRLLKQSKNELLNKFSIYAQVQTKGVLLLDDDIYINEIEVIFGFKMWKVFPDRLVGYVTRRHIGEVMTVNGTKSLRWSYGFTAKTKEYSLLLTGAVYVHVNYLKLFIEQSPEVIKVVEETKNCEDIALNFVVANYLNKPSGFHINSQSFTFLKLPKNTKNGAAPLSSRPDHYTVRTYCIQKFSEIYKRMPLKYFEGKMVPFRS